MPYLTLKSLFLFFDMEALIALKPPIKKIALTPFNFVLHFQLS